MNHTLKATLNKQGKINYILNFPTDPIEEIEKEILALKNINELLPETHPELTGISMSIDGICDRIFALQYLIWEKGFPSKDEQQKKAAKLIPATAYRPKKGKQNGKR
jgi:hypothetical protein